MSECTTKILRNLLDTNIDTYQKTFGTIPSKDEVEGNGKARIKTIQRFIPNI